MKGKALKIKTRTSRNSKISVNFLDILQREIFLIISTGVSGERVKVFCKGGFFSNIYPTLFVKKDRKTGKVNAMIAYTPPTLPVVSKLLLQVFFKQAHKNNFDMSPDNEFLFNLVLSKTYKNNLDCATKKHQDGLRTKIPSNEKRVLYQSFQDYTLF